LRDTSPGHRRLEQQVADELGVSRPQVSRLLTRARAEGIVRVTIADPFATFEEVETRLVETFGLHQAMVTIGEGLSGESLRRRIGLAAAEYLRRVLNDGFQVGIGWGRTLHAVVEALSVEPRAAIRVCPLIGSMGQVPASFQVNDLARGLAEAFGGTWQALYAPAFVGEPQARDALLCHPDMKMVMWFTNLICRKKIKPLAVKSAWPRPQPFFPSLKKRKGN